MTWPAVSACVDASLLPLILLAPPLPLPLNADENGLLLLPLLVLGLALSFFLTSIRPSKNDPPPPAAGLLVPAAVLPNREVLLLWLVLVLVLLLPNGLEDDDAGLLLPLLLEPNPDHPDVADVVVVAAPLVFLVASAGLLKLPNPAPLLLLLPLVLLPLLLLPKPDHTEDDDEAPPGPPVCTVLLRLAFPVPGPKLLPLGTLPLLLLPLPNGLLLLPLLEPKGDEDAALLALLLLLLLVKLLGVCLLGSGLRSSSRLASIILMGTAATPMPAATPMASFTSRGTFRFCNNALNAASSLLLAVTALRAASSTRMAALAAAVSARICASSA
mmetsp:Transcript_4739/g.7187  ORF Transcript_4739/g.7187 Transcript_4739/m.7187 type:complete len:329 (+) Transcript_4739:153-1139(+)